MREFRIRSDQEAEHKQLVPLETLPYGTVVEYLGEPCLVIYSGGAKIERGMVSLFDPQSTWAPDRNFLVGPVLGRLACNLDDFK